MEHLTYAFKAGRSAPANDEAHSTPHAAGPKDQETKCLNFTQIRDAVQAADDDFSTFARLSRQFERIGLHLYPLAPAVRIVTGLCLMG